MVVLLVVVVLQLKAVLQCGMMQVRVQVVESVLGTTSAGQGGEL